jgi:RNA polymerase sigma factor (sigma-70 family)
VSEIDAIVRAAQRGDMAAFGALVERFQHMVLGRAYARLDDYHLAQDVAQEVFLDAYRALPGLREPAAFAAWLRTIAHKHIDRQTRGKQLPLVPLNAQLGLMATSPDPPRLAEQRETSVAVRAAIARLPAGQREAITLYYLVGLDTATIAEALELPLSAVKKRLHDARRQLRARMPMLSDHPPRRPWDDGRFSATVQFLIAVRAGNLAEVRARLAAHPDLVAARATHAEVFGVHTYAPLEGRTPLAEAVIAGHTSVVEALLDAGADIHAQPVLHEAALRGFAAIAELLLDRGAVIDRPSPNGQTALHWTVLRGQRELLRLLLRRGADVQRASVHGRTPLHWAAISGDRAACELLLAAVADRRLRDSAGNTAADWAARRGYTALAALLRSVE